MIIEVQTSQKREVIDITELVEANLSGSGLVNILPLHTTVVLTLADLDPGTEQDYLKAIEAMTPAVNWNHPHDPSHFPDHLWASLMGQSLTLPYEGGKLKLGTWQRVAFIELKGPRTRQLEITVIKA